MSGAHDLASLPIVDAHHHLWELDRFPYGWLSPDAPPRRFGDHTAIKQNYLPDDYRHDFDGLNLTHSVHVQANCGADDPVSETRWLQSLANTHGLPACLVAQADLSKHDAADLIARHAAFPITRGVRALVAWDDAGRWRFADRPHVLADPGFREAVAVLVDHKLSLDLVVVPTQLEEVAHLAEVHPDLPIAINHFGQPEPDQTGSAQAWRAGMEAIAARPNIFLKVSGLWTIDRGWDADSLRPFLDHAVHVFGPERLMYGSNLPVEKVNVGASRQVATLFDVFEGLKPNDIQAIFSQTARTFYRL